MGKLSQNLVCACAVLSGVVLAEEKDAPFPSSDAMKWDPRFAEIKNAVNPADFDWVDVAKMPIGGRGYIDEKDPFVRVPSRFLGIVPPAVSGMGRNTTGLFFQFRTDSESLVFRARVKARVWTDPLITPSGLDSVSVWERKADGQWVFRRFPLAVKTGVTEQNLAWNPSSVCMVYFPIRAEMLEFRIGVAHGKKIEPVKTAHRVVHYGTSIVHGGCVSQAGLMFTSLYARALDCEVVNLGFSGGGRMELCMAEFLAGIETELYIVDCDWNMSVDLQKRNYEPFVRRLRELRPATPILLCGGCTESVKPREQEVFARSVYDRLKAEDSAKWKELHFFSGVEQLPKCSFATHDHCHPNDYGSVFMGAAFAKRLGAILK